MKLTKYHREAFVSAVMNDVPKVSYEEAYIKLINDDMLATADKKVVAILQDKILRNLILSGHSTYCIGSRWGAGLSCVTYAGYVPSAKTKAEVDALLEKLQNQDKTKDEVRAKVYAAISGCSTVKVALERLPEFAKYLPVEAEKGTMLPAIINLAADLAKMGWPKDAVKENKVINALKGVKK